MLTTATARWVATLGEACEKTGWCIHAWLMMNNHYHLLLETLEANLVAGMKWLQGTYTQRYWPVEAERASGTGATEEAIGAGL
ncbi:MAG: transposase [Verrucomicrobia bacterium]|nr:transposase [Verrucomicrobiota bacterium]